MSLWGISQSSCFITNGLGGIPFLLPVAEAKKFSSNISIENKGKKADLKRIFGVMGLCVKSGEQVVIEITGQDEDAAFEALKKVFEANL